MALRRHGAFGGLSGQIFRSWHSFQPHFSIFSVKSCSSHALFSKLHFSDSWFLRLTTFVQVLALFSVKSQHIGLQRSQTLAQRPLFRHFGNDLGSIDLTFRPDLFRRRFLTQFFREISRFFGEIFVRSWLNGLTVSHSLSGQTFWLFGPLKRPEFRRRQAQIHRQGGWHCLLALWPQI